MRFGASTSPVYFCFVCQEVIVFLVGLLVAALTVMNPSFSRALPAATTADPGFSRALPAATTANPGFSRALPA